ncbi:MAG: hypothetical protein JW791_01075 [Nanoarchaeota archaeon]|nr:hypothetical protein [Nanoarchaeota archaeon]
MRKGFVFVIDAVFAALIVLVFFSFLNLKQYNFTEDKILYNYLSSSLLTINDELLSEQETQITLSLNHSIPYFINYAYDVNYYHTNLTVRNNLSFGGALDNLNSLVVVNKMFWSNQGFGIITIRGGYYD